MKKIYKIFLLLIIIITTFLFLLGANIAFAGSATLSWNANSEADLAGYRIYYGTTARTGSDPKVCTMCGYSTKVDVGKVTTYTISNLTNNQTYYFSVSAYDTSNNESLFSAQVSKLVATTADLNNDSRVNTQDLSILLSYWDSTARPPADINQNGAVNTQDFSIMLSQWTS